MLKRMRWMAMGMGVGVWAQRRVRLWVRSYTPPEVAARKAGEVRSAFAEGRQAMREREAELRRKVDGQVDNHRYPPPVHYRPRVDG